ncbi:MAG TPA: 2-C-methyl-D-erythritol 2,4-cyclodiphosphate synthase [Ruminiclostridium sp.]|nr:2-C-methyl-D-erythritol 2,4-cyclodiphosphate synthase [Ruminiclostridium sp.]
MRIGHGYDAHRFASGRRLVLGGVTISYTKGLEGHSDADVLVHAVIDSLLGAAGLCDIGSLFPDTDPAFKDADSIVLLKKAFMEIKAKGLVIGNIDATIIAQEPKIKPYIMKMRENIAEACETPVYNINVKATTEEGMGFTGALEGIAAHAVCLLD